jgi:hypothetical protein
VCVVELKAAEDKLKIFLPSTLLVLLVPLILALCGLYVLRDLLEGTSKRMIGVA